MEIFWEVYSNETASAWLLELSNIYTRPDLTLALIMTVTERGPFRMERRMGKANMDHYQSPIF